jgi:hypothetical protein
MERALIAYLLGALLGAGVLLVETLVLGGPFHAGALAAYALCGGVAAASTRGLAELWLPGFGGARRVSSRFRGSRSCTWPISPT